jgi:AraC-like DNA-binding protein
MAYQAHPLDYFEAHRIVLGLIHYFSEHYQQAFTIPRLSHDIDISLIHIETAFDQYKGKTASQALLDYRLSRLCDWMSREPGEEISAQLKKCGLGLELNSDFEAFYVTNEKFIQSFGIDLVEYHQQCCLAEMTRLQRDRQQSAPSIDPLEGQPSPANQLLTRFHRPAS